MKKKRRIWIFAVAVAMTAVQGTVFAEAQETGSPVEAVKETISETTESEQILDTKALMENLKDQINLSEEAKHISNEELRSLSGETEQMQRNRTAELKPAWWEPTTWRKRPAERRLKKRRSKNCAESKAKTKTETTSSWKTFR